MIPQPQLNDLFKYWSKIPFTQLNSIDQTNGRFRIEFVVRIDAQETPKFLDKLTTITVKKHPSGSLSWVGFGTQNHMNSQYKRYRIDFIDVSIKDEIDQEKLGLYVEELQTVIRGFVSA